MKKRLMTAAAAVCSTVMMAMPVLAANAGWQRDNRGWWYRYADGGYAKSAWVSDNGNWYRMDENGYMQLGWVNGRMVRNGEVYEGQVISAWTEGSGHPEGALKEDGRRNSVIQESRGGLDADDTISAIQDAELEEAKRAWNDPEFQREYRAYRENGRVSD